MEKEKYCPRCWRRIPADVTRCPSCGVMAEEIEPTEEARSRLLTLGSLLATFTALISIIAGLMSLLTGIILYGVYLDSGQRQLYEIFQKFIIIGLSNMVGFVLGSTAGLNSWKKTSFKFTAAVTTLLPFIGLLNLMVLDVSHGIGFFWALAFAVPIIILSLSSLIFIVIKEQEFS